MCPDLYSEEVPCGPILESNYLPYETSKSSHFRWSVMGALTVCNFFIIAPYKIT